MIQTQHSLHFFPEQLLSYVAQTDPLPEYTITMSSFCPSEDYHLLIARVEDLHSHVEQCAEECSPNHAVLLLQLWEQMKINVSAAIAAHNNANRRVWLYGDVTGDSGCGCAYGVTIKIITRHPNSKNRKVP